jgi:hypothetical protein
MNADTNTVDWNKYNDLPPGPGNNFGFITTLYPPDPAALADLPKNLLDTANSPIIPFAYGYKPPTNGPVSAQGWWFLEDKTGLLARRDITITGGQDSVFCSTWFLGGTGVYHIEEGWTQGYFAETTYLPDDTMPGGIDYFLKSVWFRGVVGGQAMQDLLTACSAQRIGRDLIRGGHDRLAIYQVPATEMDRQNGKASLLVWLTIGDWRLVRTRLHASYATEVTEFRRVNSGIQNDSQVYYSEYLSQEIYQSISSYLLTHQGPFWSSGTDNGTTNPVSTGTAPTAPSQGSSGGSSGK